MAVDILSSPFATTRIFAWGMEVIMGGRKDETNPFYWDSVVQNCPGTDKYDPSMPRLYRWDSKHQVIKAAFKTFVDDPRSVLVTQKLSRYATHLVEIVMGYLVLQEATKKRRPKYQTPGEWTSSITFSLEKVGMCVTVSEKKWGRYNEIIGNLLANLNHADHFPEMNLKYMEHNTSLLVHLDIMYPLIMPFLRGVYLTMNSWSSKIDRGG